MKKYDANKSFFKTWSQNMAYILGYIYADGNLNKDKFRIQISSIDIQILNDVKEALESNHRIKECHNSLGSWYRLQIDSIEMYKDLESLGVTPNKSLTCKMPHIPKEYKYDFIRGFFDGDGCVYSKNHKDSSIPTMSIDIATGSEDFKNGLLDLLKEVEDDTHKFNIQYKKNSNVILLRGNTIVSERLYNKIYYDNCICLLRKRDKFEEILKARLNRKKKVSKAHII